MDFDKSGIVISQSQIYVDVNHRMGPEWYDHKNFEPEWHPPDNYFFIKKVGRGKYSTVFKGVQKEGKRSVTECALKILVPLDPKRYNREIKILTNLRNKKNIVQLLDLVLDPMTHVYTLVFEWVEFNDWRKLYEKLNIDDIRLYMYKLLDALETSHSNGIMHRDVKPQNIAIHPDRRRLRLLDWGLADFYHPGTKYNSHVATRVFKPPELLIEYPYYDYSVDIWSTGLTLAIMMFKKIPLKCGNDDKEQLIKVAELVGGAGIIEYADSLKIELEYNIRSELQKQKGSGWEKFMDEVDPSLCPDEAIDLLRLMTEIDHRKRITARDAMRHKFFFPLFSKQRDK